MQVRILADDLTGALDSAAAFRGEVPVFLDQPGAAGPGVPVVVVATATRDVAPATLPALLAPSVPWLATADVPFKKIDSLLRGNTFAEVAFVARAGGFADVVVAPAFPAQGRTVRDGRLWIRQPGDAAAAEVGHMHVVEALDAAGVPAAHVPDVRDDNDLERLIERVLAAPGKRTLLCGSAGLAHAVAAAAGLAARSTGVPVAHVRGRVRVMTASRHPVLRSQWPRLAVVAGTLDLALDDLAPAASLAAEAAAAHVAEQLRRLVAAVPRPDAVIVVGGDTLRAVCHACGVTALMARPALRSGWGRARFVGGLWHDVECHARSGAFGDPDDLVALALQVVPGAAPTPEGFP